MTHLHVVKQMLQSCNILYSLFLFLLMLLLSDARATPGELFTRCFTPGVTCVAPNSLCEQDVCACAPGYFATSGQCCEFLLQACNNYRRDYQLPLSDCLFVCLSVSVCMPTFQQESLIALTSHFLVVTIKASKTKHVRTGQQGNTLTAGGVAQW